MNAWTVGFVCHGAWSPQYLHYIQVTSVHLRKDVFERTRARRRVKSACLCLLWVGVGTCQRWPVVTGPWQKPGITETWCHLVTSNLLCVCVCVFGIPLSRPLQTGPRQTARMTHGRVPGVNLRWWGSSVCMWFTSLEINYLLQSMDDEHTHTHRWEGNLSSALSGSWWYI